MTNANPPTLPMLADYLSPDSGNPDFSYLSLKDLLEARESFHVHLSRKQNVVGTAIGQYLIRDSDPDKDDANKAYQIASLSAQRAVSPGVSPSKSDVPPKKDLGPRTIERSVIRPWSWPCVLVFVKKWLPRDAFSTRMEDYIPPFLYLPDGRIIPTCVVEAQPSTMPATSSVLDAARSDRFPLLQGGDPLVTYDQVQERFGTAACLVTDGATTYALTAAHVAGEPGARVYSLRREGRIGESSNHQIKKQEFSQIYPGLPVTRTYCFLDAGLVRLDNVQQWSTEVKGLGRLGDPIDLGVDTLSLKHIGLPVRGYGAASGEMTGRVLALFFRYRTLAGYDYVADLLIGPHANGKPLNTHPGDSGTLFVFDAPQAAADRTYDKKAQEQIHRAVEDEVRGQGWRPVAMQWGGQRFTGGAADLPTGEVYPFTLATNFSSILRQLDVEVIRQGDLGLPEYWGEIGHFTIGEKACELISTSDTLQTLLRNNQKSIGFDDHIIEGDDETPDFTPLSDVPDLVWKKSGIGSRGRKDNPTHSLNIDYPAENIHPQIGEVALNPKAWAKVYSDHGVKTDFQQKDPSKPYYQSERGSLPFRVWQIFEALVDFVEAGDVEHFVCAAGIMAHYVGDACQPLHGTIHFNDEGCHSPYETAMLSRHRGDVPAVVKKALGNRKASAATIADGQAAAKEIMALVRQVQRILPPQEIIDSFVNAGKPHKDTDPRLDTMWSDLGDKTGQCLAEGALLL